MKRKITEKEAIAIFLREYRKYKDAEYVRKPISKAMYEAWKIVDKKETQEQDAARDKLFYELFELQNRKDRGV